MFHLLKGRGGFGEIFKSLTSVDFAHEVVHFNVDALVHQVCLTYCRHSEIAAEEVDEVASDVYEEDEAVSDIGGSALLAFFIIASSEVEGLRVKDGDSFELDGFHICIWLRDWLQCLSQLNLHYTIYHCLNKINL